MSRETQVLGLILRDYVLRQESGWASFRNAARQVYCAPMWQHMLLRPILGLIILAFWCGIQIVLGHGAERPPFLEVLGIWGLAYLDLPYFLVYRFKRAWDLHMEDLAKDPTGI